MSTSASALVLVRDSPSQESVSSSHGEPMRRKRPNTREGRRRLVELTAILKIRSIRKSEREAVTKELDSLAPVLSAAPTNSPEVVTVETA